MPRANLVSERQVVITSCGQSTTESNLRCKVARKNGPEELHCPTDQAAKSADADKRRPTKTITNLSPQEPSDSRGHAFHLSWLASTIRRWRCFIGCGIGPRDHRFTPKVVPGSASHKSSVGAPCRHHLLRSKRHMRATPPHTQAEEQTPCPFQLSTEMFQPLAETHLLGRAQRPNLEA